MRRRTVLLLVVALLPFASGCTGFLAERLDASREDAREREGSGIGDPTGNPRTPPTPDESTEGPDAPAPEGPWPRAGSFVEYEAKGGEGQTVSWTARIRLTHDGDGWSGTCEGARAERRPDGTVARTVLDEATSYEPLRGPLDVRKGDPVAVQVPTGCGPRALQLLVQGTFPEDTVQDAHPLRVAAWWADEGAAREPQVDEDAWWDARTGLLLRWEAARHDTDVGTSGRLADTDAPLS